MEGLNKYQQLLHDIIFEDNVKIVVKIHDYIDDFLLYEDFINKVTKDLNKAGVELFNDSIDLKKSDIIWSFTAKK